jgi:hypothetical protein
MTLIRNVQIIEREHFRLAEYEQLPVIHNPEILTDIHPFKS